MTTVDFVGIGTVSKSGATGAARPRRGFSLGLVAAGGILSKILLQRSAMILRQLQCQAVCNCYSKVQVSDWGVLDIAFQIRTEEAGEPEGEARRPLTDKATPCLLFQVQRCVPYYSTEDVCSETSREVLDFVGHHHQCPCLLGMSPHTTFSRILNSNDIEYHTSRML